MLLLHHFNVFGYNSTSIVMFVCFYCYLSSAVIFFLIYLLVTAKAALPKKSLVYAAWQIANNLSQIAKKNVTSFFGLCIISLERSLI